MKWNESDSHVFDNYKEYKNRYNEWAQFLMICRKFYSEKNFLHCMDVSENALGICYLNNISIDEQFVKSVALGHDLLEDTDFRNSEDWVKLSKEMQACLVLISKGQEESYNNYIQRIKCLLDNKNSLSECVYIVKLADLIDHLMRYKTLTDSLKKRYLKALDIMLQEEN